MKVSERDFSKSVEDLLKFYGWQFVHFRPARVMRHGKETYETAYTGNKGFPDYFCTKPPRILIFELKSETGKLSQEQKDWIDLLKSCQQPNMNLYKTCDFPEVYVWRPDEIENIAKILQ